MLVREEAKEIGAYASDPEAQDIAREERQPARVLRGLADGRDPSGIARATATGTGGSLRSAVLGVYAGLGSYFRLVLGVAGGPGGAQLALTGIWALVHWPRAVAAGQVRLAPVR